jgi:hypothetical protein
MCSAGNASRATRLLGLAMPATRMSPTSVTCRLADVPSGRVPLAWPLKEIEIKDEVPRGPLKARSVSIKSDRSAPGG